MSRQASKFAAQEHSCSEDTHPKPPPGGTPGDHRGTSPGSPGGSPRGFSRGSPRGVPGESPGGVPGGVPWGVPGEDLPGGDPHQNRVSPEHRWFLVVVAVVADDDL